MMYNLFDFLYYYSINHNLLAFLNQFYWIPNFDVDPKNFREENTLHDRVLVGIKKLEFVKFDKKYYLIDQLVIHNI